MTFTNPVFFRVFIFYMEQINLYGWNGYRLAAGDVSLVVTPDIGGRVISLKHQDEEIFFVQKEHQGEVFDFSQVSAWRLEKSKLGFRLWGGDKTWIAPQKDWWDGIPPLALDAGRYRTIVEDSSVVVQSQVCPETGLEVTRRITLRPDGAIHLRQEIVNKSEDTVRKGIWNVTQILRPFDVYVPSVRSKLRSYHEEDLTLPECQIIVAQEGDWCQIPCRDNTLFKIGGMTDAGILLSLRRTKNETIAFLKTFDFDKTAIYAHRSVVEVFNARDYDYLEIEIHAPFIPLKPGDGCHHDQLWRLKRFKGAVSPDEAYQEFTGLRYHK